MPTIFRVGARIKSWNSGARKDDVAAFLAAGKIDLKARKGSARQLEVDDAGPDNLPQRQPVELRSRLLQTPSPRIPQAGATRRPTQCQFRDVGLLWPPQIRINPLETTTIGAAQTAAQTAAQAAGKRRAQRPEIASGFGRGRERIADRFDHARIGVEFGVQLVSAVPTEWRDNSPALGRDRISTRNGIVYAVCIIRTNCPSGAQDRQGKNSNKKRSLSGHRVLLLTCVALAGHGPLQSRRRLASAAVCLTHAVLHDPAVRPGFY